MKQRQVPLQIGRRLQLLLGKYHILSIPGSLKFSGKKLFIVAPGETEVIKGKIDNWRILHTIKDHYGNDMIALVEVGSNNTVDFTEY